MATRPAPLKRGFLISAIALAGAVAATAVPSAARAAATVTTGDAPTYNGTQLHVRAGMVGASFSGPDVKITTPNASDPSSGATSTSSSGAVKLEGSFSIKTSLDIDYEIFSGGRSSLVLHGTIAHDLSENRLKYAYMGVGRRFYLGSSGMAYDLTQAAGSVSSVPEWRYYLGGEVGISQVTVGVSTAVYQIQSALVELGATAGVIKQLSKSLGIELQAGYGFGLGFSSVSVGATTQRVLLGVSYYY